MLKFAPESPVDNDIIVSGSGVVLNKSETITGTNDDELVLGCIYASLGLNELK